MTQDEMMDVLDEISSTLMDVTPTKETEEVYENLQDYIEKMKSKFE